MYYNADLHVHLGRTKSGKPVKITASPSLTVENIFEKCIEKGIDIVGIVDCAVPEILDELEDLVKNDVLKQLDGGGLIYKNKIVLQLVSEIEVGGELNGSPHLLCFLKDIESMKAFSNILSKYISNINLSTQKCRLNSVEILKIAKDFDGFVVPAHVFTPYKSYYGSTTDRLSYIFEEYYDDIFAVELGLSSDTYLGDMISELSDKVFLSNSDAHSLQKIGREFNVFDLSCPSFESIKMMLKSRSGITRNYGLNPALGKYHRTFCLDCCKISNTNPPIHKCAYCNSENVVFGVLDRIYEIKDQKMSHPTFRPEYIYQIPLEFIPGIGSITMKKLFNEVGSEIYILHEAPFEQLKECIGEKLAKNIIDARYGNIKVKAGGGGIYGKII
ncbi:histidinol-phosphatase [Thermoanaerobacterium thermosaccharolyticum]|uniref:Histidinol-phosphatase n=1 Tax=Thermoanaerobacterium thermosaccharolyticum TaxID=1517 RepID=A0A231VHE3_THETR|nr:endonuclease Q family protein [Thermoanaerobacterium thermosaccharolyticum]OXT07620.1 histidinol-phosphatase [Thermoanaerobacterium thermosaccharolyticum]